MALHPKVVLEPEDLVTVYLPDGRVIDVFPSGTLQVYSEDLKSAYELYLPKVEHAERTVPVRVIG